MSAARPEALSGAPTQTRVDDLVLESPPIARLLWRQGLLRKRPATLRLGGLEVDARSRIGYAMAFRPCKPCLVALAVILAGVAKEVAGFVAHRRGAVTVGRLRRREDSQQEREQLAEAWHALNVRAPVGNDLTDFGRNRCDSGCVPDTMPPCSCASRCCC